MDTRALFDINEIRSLKARYCRLLDTEQWESWAEVFTPDVVIDISDDVKADIGEQIIRGRDEFVSQTH